MSGSFARQLRIASTTLDTHELIVALNPEDCAGAADVSVLAVERPVAVAVAVAVVVAVVVVTGAAVVVVTDVAICTKPPLKVNENYQRQISDVF